VKILLTNPPSKDRKKFIREGRCTQEEGAWGTLWPPVSLATIGAVLEAEKYSISIIDCAARGDDWEDLSSQVSQFKPDIIVLSTGTPTINNDLNLCAWLKEKFPQIITIAFGTHVTALDKESMKKYPSIDFIVRNEPEITIKELVRALLMNDPIESIQGITFRDKNRGTVSNPARPFIENLDSLPFPAWHKVDINLYRLPLKGNRYLIVSPLRGCPYRCSFCTCQTYYGNRVRRRSPESVISEIRYDMEKFGVKDFFFWAETFVIDKEFVRRLCNGILEAGIKISWTANSRVDTVDESLLKLMADAGCWMLSYGIESAEQKVLDSVLKGTKVEHAKIAIDASRKAGIKTAGHFIFGLPGDSEESIKKTIDYAMTLDLDFAQFYSAVPFPGSQIYSEALTKGWIKSDGFENYRQDNAIMILPSLPPERVNYYRRVAFRRFYISFKTFFVSAKLLRLRNIGRIIAVAKNFFAWTLKSLRAGKNK
jgi:anaerobic magnesium-protoporphyrin IX monomethyl ester cyclase